MERILTENEKRSYIDAVSKNVFRKPFTRLEKEQIATLKLNLYVRKEHSDELTDNEYHQLLDWVQKAN